MQRCAKTRDKHRDPGPGGGLESVLTIQQRVGRNNTRIEIPCAREVVPGQAVKPWAYSSW